MFPNRDEVESMLPIDKLKVARASDLPPGTLVAHFGVDSYVLGLIVSIPQRPNGVLLLEAPTPHRAPTFAMTSAYCLSYGGPPQVEWTGTASQLRNARTHTPGLGHLAIVGDEHLISGLMPGYEGGPPMYWNLRSGKPVGADDRDLQTIVYIASWRLGLLDNDGKFQQLIEFKAS
jgi:hypothetical protein